MLTRFVKLLPKSNNVILGSLQQTINQTTPLKLFNIKAIQNGDQTINDQQKGTKWTELGPVVYLEWGRGVLQNKVSNRKGTSTTWLCSCDRNVCYLQATPIIKKLSRVINQEALHVYGYLGWPQPLTRQPPFILACEHSLCALLMVQRIVQTQLGWLNQG